MGGVPETVITVSSPVWRCILLVATRSKDGRVVTRLGSGREAAGSNPGSGGMPSLHTVFAGCS